MSRASKNVLGILAALVLGLPALAHGGTVSVTTGTKYQVIQGFGASSYSESVSTAQSTALFKDQSNAALGTQSSGTSIGLSILRLSIDEGGNFATEGNDGKNGVAANPNLQVFASEWSPPAADKNSDNVDGPGTNGNAGNTNTNFAPTEGAGTNTPITGDLSAYATYQAGFASTMDKTYGVKLYAVSPQNEPDWNATYDSCLWTPQQFDTYIPLLKTALTTAGESGVKIMFPESFADNLTGANTAMADTAVAPDVGIVANHLYGADNGGVTGAAAPLPASYYTNDPNVQSWITEESEHAGYGVATWTFDNDTLWYAQQIHDFLADKDGNAYCYWWIQNSAGNTGDDEGLYTSGGALTSTYYMMGNWSMFIRPGYTRVAASPEVPSGTGGLGKAGVEVSAYTGTATEGGATVDRVVIVAINGTGAAVSQTFSYADQTVTQVYPWISDTADNLAAQAVQTVTGGQFTYTLPADSVTTFVADCASSSTPTNSPTFTRTATLTSTLTTSPTFTRSATLSPSASATPTRSLTASPTSTESGTATPTLSATPSGSPSRTGTPTLSSTVTGSVSPTPSPTESKSQTASPTLSPTLSGSPSLTLSATATRTTTFTTLPSGSPTATATLTGSPAQTATATRTPTDTGSPSGTPSGTATTSPMPSASATLSATETVSGTVSPSGTPSSATPTGTGSPSGTATLSPTFSPSETATVTATFSQTGSPSSSPTVTDTDTTGSSPTDTPSAAATESASPSGSPSPSVTASRTDSPSPMASATASFSATKTGSVTASPTETAKVLASATATAPAATATAVTGGPLVIEHLASVPNPNPKYLDIDLNGSADRVVLTVYTTALVQVGQTETGPLMAGWTSVPVGGLFDRLAPGLYYVVAEAWRGNAHSAVVLAKVFLLRP
jgi:O-glycosyl hydrolase